MFNGINVNGTQLIPTIISYSWGMPETYADVNDLIETNVLLKNKNINVCVATGDNGSSDGTTTLNVDFPSSSPYVTSVGGTSLICPNNVYDTKTVETVWNDGTTATGGGISKIFAKPQYQNYIPGTKRNSPDIAFNSDPGTGIQLYFNGKIAYGIGGTSLAAPFFAGFIALSGIKTFINPLLYSNTCYHDIKLGSNSINIPGQYSATLGYDNCSGIGSMDCSKFVLNPYILLPFHLNIKVGQIVNIPIKTNLNVSWELSNKNISISGNRIKGNYIGTTILRARANNLFATMNVNIINPNSFKMVFTK
jgi:kumamolisin